MKLRQWLLLAAATGAMCLLVATMGCGGASLNMGGNRNLEQVDPDFTDPLWYEDFQEDRTAANKRFKGKVLQIDVMVTEMEEAAGGITVMGSTGELDRYRASCVFPASAGNALQAVRVGREITVKGLFDYMQETANSHRIYLKHCVLVND